MLQVDFRKILGVGRLWTREELIEFWSVGVEVRISTPAAWQ